MIETTVLKGRIIKFADILLPGFPVADSPLKPIGPGNPIGPLSPLEPFSPCNIKYNIVIHFRLGDCNRYIFNNLPDLLFCHPFQAAPSDLELKNGNHLNCTTSWWWDRENMHQKKGWNIPGGPGGPINC